MVEETKHMFVQLKTCKKEPFTVNKDYQAACDKIDMQFGTNHKKLTDLRQHLMRSMVTGGQLRFSHVPTAAQNAEIFTKSLQRMEFHRQCLQLALSDR